MDEALMVETVTDVLFDADYSLSINGCVITVFAHPVSRRLVVVSHGVVQDTDGQYHNIKDWAAAHQPSRV